VLSELGDDLGRRLRHQRCVSATAKQLKFHGHHICAANAWLVHNTNANQHRVIFLGPADAEIDCRTGVFGRLNTDENRA
jgi:sulfur transfer protein SufE